MSSEALGEDEQSALGLGFKYIPKPRDTLNKEIRDSLQNFERTIRIRKQFAFIESGSQRFYIPNPSFQPEPAGEILETYLKTVRNKMEKAMKKHPANRKPNLKLKEILTALKRKENVIFKSADKDSSTVVMDKIWYEEEALRQLRDTSTYERIGSLPGQDEIFCQLIEILNYANLYRSLINNSRTKLAKYLLQDYTLLSPKSRYIKGARFYLKIKTHKNPIVGRPIAASRGTPTYFASKYLDKQLQPIMKMGLAYTKNSGDILLDLEQQIFPKDAVLVAFDVESLYPSIDVNEAIAALKEKLEPLTAVISNTHIKFLLSLASFILNNNYIEFSWTYWRQIKGTAMGTPAAVCIANIFLDVLETKIFEQYERPLFFKRFIDDGLVIFNSRAEAEHFVAVYNNSRESIKITSTISEESVTFLDLEVFKGERFNKEGKFDVRIFQKSTNNFLYLPMSSAHSPKVLRSFIRAEAIRYRVSCTNDVDFENSVTLFRERLKRRGYSERFLYEVLDGARNLRRQPLLDKIGLQTQPRDQETNFAETWWAVTFPPPISSPATFKITYTPRLGPLRIGSCLELPEGIEADPAFTKVFGRWQKPMLCITRPRNIGDYLVRSSHTLHNKWVEELEED